MTYSDLPRQWGELPLTDNQLLADVVDLFLHERDRRNGAVLALVCTADAHLSLPVVVDDIPLDLAPNEQRHVVDTIVRGVHQAGEGAIALAVGRPGSPEVGPSDLGWAHAIQQACQAHRQQYLGTFLALPGQGRVRRMDDDAAAA